MSAPIDTFSPAHAMLAAMQARQISAVELLDMHLARIAEHNPALNAIVTHNEAQARAEAERVDAALAAKQSIGRLAGLPLTIKDNIPVAGLPTTNGLPEQAGNIATRSAPSAQRLLDAGAVLLGKTNLSTNAGDWQAENALFGRTNNPWDRTRTPGGSTGGGGAALAAGLTSLELGTDIGGSIRIPAAFCGVYGHRPSDGIVPRVWQPNPGRVLNVHGPLARSADDLELALEVLAGPANGEELGWRLELSSARHQAPHEFRIAVLPPIGWVLLDDQVQAAQEDLIGMLRGQGTMVEMAQPEGFEPDAHERLYAALLAAMECEGMDEDQRAAFAAEMRRSPNRFGVAQAEGATASAPQYLALLQERERYREMFREFFRHYDLLLTPMSPVPAFPHIPEGVPLPERTLAVGGQTMHYEQLSVYPGIATVSGLPATAFPWGATRAGLPIGMQAVGPYLKDRTPLRFAQLLERQHGGFAPPPGLA